MRAVITLPAGASTLAHGPLEAGDARSGRWCRRALTLDQLAVAVENDQSALADQDAVESAIADHFVNEAAADAG